MTSPESFNSGWWREAPRDFLVDVLTAINSSRSSTTAEGRRKELGRALRMCWNAAAQTQKRRASSLGSQTVDELDGDQFLAKASADEIDEIFERLFEHPSRRLAVYGSLRPGESNAHQMAGIEGEWLDGTVPGIIRQPGEYLEFTWQVDSAPVAVKVLVAPKLSEHFERLDEFEGPEYQRTLVPVLINNVIQICNIYEARVRG